MSDPLPSNAEPAAPQLALVTPVAPSNLVTADREIRYQVRSLPWGDKRRFAVRDTVTDTTLTIRATQNGAEDDIIVLNIVGPGGLGLPSPPQLAPRDRRCGRCRQVFAPDPAEDRSALEDWWLCAGCRRKLLGAVPNSSAAGVARRLHPAGGPAVPGPRHEPHA